MATKLQFAQRGLNEGDCGLSKSQRALHYPFDAIKAASSKVQHLLLCQYFIATHLNADCLKTMTPRLSHCASVFRSMFCWRLRQECGFWSNLMLNSICLGVGCRFHAKVSCSNSKVSGPWHVRCRLSRARNMQARSSLYESN